MDALKLFKVLLAVCVIKQTFSDFEFTNIICDSLDEQFASIDYCYLKSVNRTYKYASLKVKLHKVPVEKIKINFAIYKRLNGYKPFLYNVTFDASKFMKNRKINPVASFLMDLFVTYSNMNHGCPYNNDVYVEKAPASHLNDKMTFALPFPEGSYGFYSVWYAYDVARAQVNVYGTLS
nr:uncharacterized protein LOC108129229 [Drosophila bipectinata]